MLVTTGQECVQTSVQTEERAPHTIEQWNHVPNEEVSEIKRSAVGKKVKTCTEDLSHQLRDRRVCGGVLSALHTTG